MRRALTAALTVFTACSAPGGSDAGGAGGGGAAGLALSDYCDAFHQADCALAVRCGGLDPGSCARLADSFGAGCLGGDVSLIDAGSLRYDGTAAQACLGQLATAPCSPRAFSVLDDCRHVFVGTVPVGGSCYGAECTLDGYCDSSAGLCPGTCLARANDAGEPGVPCPDGTYGNGVCAPLVSLGGDCASPGSLFGRACVLGAFCDVQSDGGATCRAFDGLGAPCSSLALNCSPYATCGVGADGGRACAALAPSGTACGGAGGVACQVGLACSSHDGGVCGPLFGEGAPCRASECAPPLFCAFSSPLDALGTCAAPAGLDAGCPYPNGCASGLACAINSRCVTAAGPNAPCVPGGCVAGQQCSGGTCKPLSCEPP